MIERDAIAGPDMRMNCCECRRRECGRVIDDAAAWQRTERGVEVIEIRVGQHERDARHAEMLLQDTGCGSIGAKARADPELTASRVPDAIAGALKRDACRDL